MSATSEQAINYLKKYVSDKQRLEMERADSKLCGKDTDFIEGYKCAANKAIEWFNKKMYCLMIDGTTTLGDQFKNENAERFIAMENVCENCLQRQCIYRSQFRSKCEYVDDRFAKQLSELMTNKIKNQMENTSVKPFYMVYVMGQSAPRKTYDNYADASKEAQRLCDYERKTAYVLKSICGYEFYSQINEISVEEL